MRSLTAGICSVLPFLPLFGAVDVTDKDYAIKAPAWKAGLYEWPSAYPKCIHNDWKGYDRLVIDVTNLGDDGDQVGLYVAGPDGKVQNGLRRSFAMPAWETVRWEVKLGYWPHSVSPDNITRIQFYSHKPQSLNAVFSGMRLLRPGEKAPAPATPAQVKEELRKGREKYLSRKAERRSVFVKELAAANRRDGIDGGRMLIGAATSMEHIRPRDTYSLGSLPALSLRLARNECEALQLAVTPAEGALEDVSVRVSPLKLRQSWWSRLRNGPAQLPYSAVKVSVMGYVRTVTRPRYGVGYNTPTNNAVGYVRRSMRAPLGWWPDPILSYLDSADVGEGDVQSFWLEVKCPENQRAGVYEGAVEVSARGVRPVRLPLSVRVNNFTLGRKPVIPTLVSFSPGVYIRPDRKEEDRAFAAACKADPASPLNMWKKRRFEWGDFLADRFVTMAPLYHHGGELPYDVWARLKEQGRMGLYNLAYFSPQALETEKQRKNFIAWSGWVKSVISNRVSEAVRHGVEKNAVLYCFDEVGPGRFAQVEVAANMLKDAFPDVPLLTTTFDDTFGAGKYFKRIDGFIPQTVKFDVKRAEVSRAAGHQVWWYFACDQKAPQPNIFTESQPIEQRLLMGAMAARYRPDGFLYYQSAYFNSPRCITGGPFTEWNPRSWWGEHGDGTWVAVGPDGMPLSTQRFENFRDGFEDLAYAELLRAKLKADPAAPWAAEAEKLLEVPVSVFEKLDNFTDDPAAVYAWRDRMADLIVR
jgi:hypothetical protein